MIYVLASNTLRVGVCDSSHEISSRMQIESTAWMSQCTNYYDHTSAATTGCGYTVAAGGVTTAAAATASIVGLQQSSSGSCVVTL